MAVTVSGLFCLTARDILLNDTAVDLTADQLKCALFTNAITPNYDTDTRYGAAPYNASEVGTAAGGIVMTSPTLVVSAGAVIFDAADTTWAPQTFANARAALIYDNTITTPVAQPAIALVTFGADYSVTSGIFTIQWAAGGIFALDLTP